TEIKQAREGPKGIANRDDVMHGFQAEATDRAERHANGARGGLDVLGVVALNLVSICALIHAWRQNQHSPAPRFLNGRAETEMRRAVVEGFAEKGGCCRRVHLGAGLRQHVLREGERVTVTVQVARVLLQQSQERVELL